MPLLEHLEELRRRLVWIFASVGVAAVAGWFTFERVVERLLEPARPYLTDLGDGNLIFTGPLEAFTLRLKVAVYVGFAIALPIVLWQVWRFVSPGLHRKERRYAVPFVLSGLVLFGGGVVVALLFLPQALRFLIGPEITGASVSPLLSAKPYMDFALRFLLVFGIAFQFPVILMFLSLLGVIDPRRMGKYRRHVFVGLAVVSAVLTPPDWITMAILTFTLYVLYESCIWLTRLIRR